MPQINTLLLALALLGPCVAPSSAFAGKNLQRNHGSSHPFQPPPPSNQEKTTSIHSRLRRFMSALGGIGRSGGGSLAQASGQSAASGCVTVGRYILQIKGGNTDGMNQNAEDFAEWQSRYQQLKIAAEKAVQIACAGSAGARMGAVNSAASPPLQAVKAAKIPGQPNNGRGRHGRGEMTNLGPPPKQAAAAASSAAQPGSGSGADHGIAYSFEYSSSSSSSSRAGVKNNQNVPCCPTPMPQEPYLQQCRQCTGSQTAAAVAAPPASGTPHPWAAAATPTGGNAAGDEVILEEDLAFDLFFEVALTEEEAAVISQILNEASAAGEMDIELGGKTFQPTAEVLSVPAAAFYAEHPEFAASAGDDAAAGSKSNAGTIAAAVVALLVLLVAVVGSVAMYLKKRRSSATTAAYAATIDTTAPAVALTTTTVAHGGAGALPYPCLSV